MRCASLSGRAGMFRRSEPVTGESSWHCRTSRPEQRQQALDKAPAARQARSELLEQVKTGQLTVPQVLQRAEADEIAQKTKVPQLLKALPGYGPTKASQVLEHADITENWRVGGLGPRATPGPARRARLSPVAICR